MKCLRQILTSNGIVFKIPLKIRAMFLRIPPQLCPKLLNLGISICKDRDSTADQW